MKQFSIFRIEFLDKIAFTSDFGEAKGEEETKNSREEQLT